MAKDSPIGRLDVGEKYSTIIEKALDGIILIEDETIIYANAAAHEIAGYNDGELPGKHFLDLIPADYHKLVKRRYSQRVSGKKLAPRIQLSLSQKNGLINDVEMALVTTKFGQNNVLIVYFKDITERLNAEKALKESLEVSADLVRTIPSGLFIYELTDDDRMILLEGNPMAETLTGIKVKDWLGRDFDEIWPEAKERGITDAYLQAAKSGITYETEDLYYKDERIEGAFLIRAFSLPGNKVAVAFENITQRKKMEEDGKRLEEQLRQAQKMEAIGTLAGGIAHDFNNLLGIIMGFSELSHDELPDGHPVREYQEEVIKASERAKELIQQILIFSRKTSIIKKPLALAGIITDSIRMLRSILPTNINIRPLIADIPGIIRCNQSQIQQVIINIGSNAGYAMRENGGTLDISLEERFLNTSTDSFSNLKMGRYLQLSFSDTGEGMPPELLQRIFEPYFTTKPEGSGSGIGLAVTHGIVKSHGGEIVVHSNPGRGSTFDVYFPLLEVDGDYLEATGSSG